MQAEGRGGTVVTLHVDRGTIGNLRTQQRLTPETGGGGLFTPGSMLME